MCICPMVVSQWGLNSKSSPGKTGPGHSMVVSQWSSSEHRIHQSTWRTSAYPQRCPRTARGGARVAAATDYLAHKGPPSEVPAHGQRGGESSSSYRFHGESPRRVTKPLTPQGLTPRDLPIQASHTRLRHSGTGLRIDPHQVPSPKPARYVGKEMGGLTSPSRSHQCGYIQRQPRPLTRRFTVSPSQVEQSRATARNVVGVNLRVPKHKVAPWWSASGDLTARTKG